MGEIGTFSKAADGIDRGCIRGLLLHVDLEIRQIEQANAASQLGVLVSFLQKVTLARLAQNRPPESGKSIR